MLGVIETACVDVFDTDMDTGVPDNAIQSTVKPNLWFVWNGAEGAILQISDELFSKRIAKSLNGYLGVWSMSVTTVRLTAWSFEERNRAERTS